jgi:hypothetical protein
LFKKLWPSSDTKVEEDETMTVYTYRPDHVGTLVLHSVRTFKVDATAEAWADMMRNAGYIAETYV